MSKPVSNQNATKSKDWECSGRFNLGDESYRKYESKSTGENTVFDGKNEKAHLSELRSTETEGKNRL